MCDTMAFAIPKLIYAVIAVVIVAAIALYLVLGSSPETVANGDTVQVFYTGSFTNGTVFDTNVGGQPLQFKVGSGQVISGFDQAVIGMKANETKNVTLSPSEAYGQVNPALIVDVPRTLFGNQSIQVGSIVTTNSSNGPMQGRVTGLNDTNVTVDFNPQLAGKTLVFRITVASIQKA